MRTIIIGGVAAGTTAAAKLKRLKPDYEVVLYEKSSYISLGACGLPYYIGDVFDDPNDLIARTPEQFEKQGIHVKTEHEVLKVIPETQTVVVKNLKTQNVFENTYDKLIIASGAKAVVPPIKNIDLENVYTVRRLEEGIELKEKLKDKQVKKVGVIGGGAIGIEMIEAAKAYGKDVHLFQIEARVLESIYDVELTDVFEKELKKHHVNLHFESIVRALKGENKVEGIVTETKEIEVDLVIIATGVKPETSFIEDTKIKKLSNGAIVINEKGETSIPNIYAAGDCTAMTQKFKETTQYIPLATYANKYGRLIGENIAGEDKALKGILGSSCIKIMDLEAVSTGLTEQDAKKEGILYQTVFIQDKNHPSYYPGQSTIYIKLIYHKETKVLLGGQVVGERDAVQRGNILAVAIYAGLTTDELGMMDLCYAPPFSRTWDVVNVAGNVAK